MATIERISEPFIMGYGIRSNKKTLLTIMVGSVFFLFFVRITVSLEEFTPDFHRKVAPSP